MGWTKILARDATSRQHQSSLSNRDIDIEWPEREADCIHTFRLRLRMRGSMGFHTGHCVDEQLVSQPHTQVAWQDMHSSDVTDTCPLCLEFPAKLAATHLTVSTAVARVNSRVKSVCYSSGPATRKCPSHCSATVLSPSHVVCRLESSVRPNGLAVAAN